MKPTKFKFSYTTLRAWEQGNYEDAIKYFYRLPVERSRAMIEGGEYHERWEREIQNTKKLPVVFGSKQLVNPSPEQYIKVQVSDWLILSGKIDCYDKPTIYEFKTGKANSEEIARSKQPGVYAVLSTLNRQYASIAEIHCFNQHLNADNKSMSIVHLTDKVLQDSLNWIETLASDMRHYIEMEKLYEKFTQKI